MIKYLFIFLIFPIIFSKSSLAALSGVAQTEILSDNSEIWDFQFKNFSQSSSFDSTGTKVDQNPGDMFTLHDWKIQYSKGIKERYEASSFLNYRSVKSETQSSSGVNSGLESIGISGKYLIHVDSIIRSAFGIHAKKALYNNTQYTTSFPPPSDKVALGDDGLEYGLDYFQTYYSKLKKFDFQVGYNKPSGTLSSEITYNFDVIFDVNKWSVLSGIGGILSLKNDSYSNALAQKPMIGSGNSRLFNSVNREMMNLHAGVQYPVNNFLLGFKMETVLSGKSTDKGNTFLLNVRWEPKKTNNITTTISANDFADHKYFADGFVEKVANAGEFLKINIGLDKNLYIGAKIDIFNIYDYAKGIPVANGEITQVDAHSSIVKIITKYSSNPIQMAYLVRVY